MKQNSTLDPKLIKWPVNGHNRRALFQHLFDAGYGTKDGIDWSRLLEENPAVAARLNFHKNSKRLYVAGHYFRTHHLGNVSRNNLTPTPAPSPEWTAQRRAKLSASMRASHARRTFGKVHETPMVQANGLPLDVVQHTCPSCRHSWIELPKGVEVSATVLQTAIRGTQLLNPS